MERERERERERWGKTQAAERLCSLFCAGSPRRLYPSGGSGQVLFNSMCHAGVRKGHHWRHLSTFQKYQEKGAGSE